MLKWKRVAWDPALTVYIFLSGSLWHSQLHVSPAVVQGQEMVLWRSHARLVVGLPQWVEQCWGKVCAPQCSKQHMSSPSEGRGVQIQPFSCCLVFLAAVNGRTTQRG